MTTQDCSITAPNCKESSSLFSTSDGGRSFTQLLFPRTVAKNDEVIHHESTLTVPNGFTESPGIKKAQPNVAPIGLTNYNYGYQLDTNGFDIQLAPALATMQTWRNQSIFSVVGAYIGGENSKGAPSYTAAWIYGALCMGWKIIPLYVGKQAPCVLSSIPMSKIKDGDFAQAELEGAQAADDAVTSLQNRGMFNGTSGVIYLDLEAYDGTNYSCTQDVNSFETGWTNQMHNYGFKSGVYGSPYNAQDWINTGTPDAVMLTGSPNRPLKS